MFSNAPSRQEIDDLNAVWDDVVRGNVVTGSEADMARRLQHLAPALDSAAKQRLRTRVLAAQPSGMVAPPRPRSVDPVSLRTPLSTPKRAQGGLFLRLAAVSLLMLSIAGAWLGVRHFSESDASPTPLQGAIPASPSNTSANPRQTLFQLDIPAAGLREFGVYILESEMPAMARWDLSTAAFALGDQALSFYVEAGVLTVEHKRESDGYGVINSYGPGSAISGPLPSEVRVEGPSPTKILILFAMAPGDVLPKPEGIPGGLQVIGGASVKQSAGVPLTIDFVRTTAQGAGADPIRASDDERVAMVWVTTGSVMLDTPGGESVKTGLGSMGADSMFAQSTGEPTMLGTGQVCMADVNSTLGQHGSVVGNEPFSAYVMTVQEGAPSPGAIGTPDSGLAMNWFIPMGTQRVGLAVRAIMLEPGAEYRYSFDGVFTCLVSAGQITIGAGTRPTILSTNEMIVQVEARELLIRNPGPGVAVIQLATASASMPAAQLAQPPDAAINGVTVNSVAAGDLPVTPGNSEVRLNVIPIDKATTLSHTEQDGVALVVATTGNAEVFDGNGLITVGRIHPDAMKNTPGTLLEGDYLLIPDGATYTVSGANEHVTTLLWFTVTPLDPPIIATLTPVNQADLTIPSPTPNPMPMPTYVAIAPLTPTPTP